MQSHDDRSHSPIPEIFRELFERGKQMTEEGTNRITAGSLGEQVVAESELDGVLLRRMPDEQGVYRISIGRAYAIGEGAYCVYRGEPRKILGLLERCVGAMRKDLADRESKG